MKITLRELFLVLLVVALSLGWWLDRSRLASKYTRMENAFHGACELAGHFAWVVKGDENAVINFDDECRITVSCPERVNGLSGFTCFRLDFDGNERVKAIADE